MAHPSTKACRKAKLKPLGLSSEDYHYVNGLRAPPSLPQLSHQRVAVPVLPRQAGSTHAVVSSRAGALARFRAAVVCLVSSRPAASPLNQRCDHHGSGRTPYTSHRRAPCQGISEAVLGG